MKQGLVHFLRDKGHEVLDAGANLGKPDDCPDYLDESSRLVNEGGIERGILICDTGTGMSIAARKMRGAQATLCHDACTVSSSRRHGDANILTMDA